MKFNHAQRQYLARFGSKPFDSLPVEVRLEVANLASVPDPIEAKPADRYTKAQIDYLGDRRVEDLASDLDKENFAYLGGEAFRDKTETPKEAPFALDAASLAGHSPESRLDVARAFETIEKGRAERRADVHPAALRVSDNEMTAAHQRVAPFLVKTAA